MVNNYNKIDKTRPRLTAARAKRTNEYGGRQRKKNIKHYWKDETEKDRRIDVAHFYFVIMTLTFNFLMKF